MRNGECISFLCVLSAIMQCCYISSNISCSVIKIGKCKISCSMRNGKFALLPRLLLTSQWHESRDYAMVFVDYVLTEAAWGDNLVCMKLKLLATSRNSYALMPISHYARGLVDTCSWNNLKYWVWWVYVAYVCVVSTTQLTCTVGKNISNIIYRKQSIPWEAARAALSLLEAWGGFRNSEGD